MPHTQSESLAAHSTVPPLTSHPNATSLQPNVGDGSENESGTAWPTADSGTELHGTATTVYDGIELPTWDAETQAFFATHPGLDSVDGSLDASLDPLERANSDLLLHLVAAPLCYDNFLASLGVPPLELPSAHDPAADTIAVEAATYEPENYDEGVDDNVAPASTSHSASGVPPTGPDTVDLTWLPVSTPQQVVAALPTEQAPHNTVGTPAPHSANTPYGLVHAALSTSYFASQPVPAVPNYWHGAQYPVAGPSRIQNTNVFYPGYPVSAATTPSVYHLSLPPTPAAGTSVAPSSGPVRKTRSRSRATTGRKPAATGVPVKKRRGHCAAVATLSDEHVEQIIANARATQYAQNPTARCDWAGCTDPVDLKGFFGHLKTVHGVQGGEVPTLCRWGTCSGQLRGDSFRKHVLSHAKLKLMCPSCLKWFQSDVTLRKHLKGARLVGKK
ncbi:hypothetical protein C8R47DRAFT_170460 [Mycena vitilis]|nr:hypothetical protein C8R47DRAFT_170460 [Mycena vitilis]